MGNVTQRGPAQTLRAHLDLLLTSYRTALQVDNARLQAAMRDYEATLRHAQLRKVA